MCTEKTYWMFSFVVFVSLVFFYFRLFVCFFVCLLFVCYLFVCLFICLFVVLFMSRALVDAFYGLAVWCHIETGFSGPGLQVTCKLVTSWDTLPVAWRFTGIAGILVSLCRGLGATASLICTFCLSTWQCVSKWHAAVRWISQPADQQTNKPLLALHAKQGTPLFYCLSYLACGNCCCQQSPRKSLLAISEEDGHQTHISFKAANKRHASREQALWSCLLVALRSSFMPGYRRNGFTYQLVHDWNWRPTLLSHQVTLYWLRVNQSQLWSNNTRCLAL